MPLTLAPAAALLERDVAIRQIADAVAAAREGRGALVTLAGAAGMGKTTLLAVAEARARDQGLAVMRAQGGEDERDLPFGITRQLLERPILAASPAERAQLLAGPAAPAARVFGLDSDAPGVDPTPATIHGLFWATANLAESGGLVMLVDDGHWSDEESWRWLVHLARRLDGLPIALFVAGRGDEPGLDGRDLRLLGAEPVVLEPLSSAGVSRLLSDRLGRPADEPFARACHELTSGNPFLTVELVRSVEREILEPTARDVTALASVVPNTVTWSVRSRLRRLSGQAGAAATAIAVLGDARRLSDVSALVGLEADATVAAVDELVDAELVGSELSFIHPLVKAAVYQALAPAERSRLHRRAAGLLAEARAPREEVATHLLATFAGNESWVAEQLLGAAAEAGDRAAYSSAVAYLRRALAEASPDELYATVVTELGLAEAHVGDGRCVEHLGEALDLCRDPVRGAEVARALGRTLALEGRVPEALDALERGLALLPPAEAALSMRLEADVQAIGRTDPETIERANDRLSRLLGGRGVESLAEVVPELAAQRAAWLAASDWRETEQVASSALGGGALLRADGPEAIDYWTKVQALAWCDRYSLALEHANSGLSAAQAAGSLAGYVLAMTYRAELFCRRGYAGECEADARAALEAIEEHGLRLPAALALAWLTTALVEQERLTEAWQILGQHGLERETPRQNVFAMVVHARALAHMAGGEPERARTDALAAGALLLPIGPGPAPLPWRSTAALAAHALGDLPAARELSGEELTLARRYGAPRALGIALRTAAVVGETDPELDESVAVLEASEVRAELARSLLERGRRLRRAREIAESRTVLAQALDLAHECRASALERQARDELMAAGARPRRPRLHGEDALTARERRVAELAAGGLSNKQIAQQLFLSVRTVEAHLGRVYRKLATNREHLHKRLAGD